MTVRAGRSKRAAKSAELDDKVVSGPPNPDRGAVAAEMQRPPPAVSAPPGSRHPARGDPRCAMRQRTTLLKRGPGRYRTRAPGPEPRYPSPSHREQTYRICERCVHGEPVDRVGGEADNETASHSGQRRRL